MQTKGPSAIGYLSIFLCCLAGSISFVFIGHLTRNHDSMLSLAMTFGYAIILFNLFNFNKIKPLYSMVAKNINPVFAINLLSLLNWFSSFMCLKYIDPATGLCIILSIVAITIFLISTPFSQLKKNKHLIFANLAIVINMGLIIKQYADTTSHISNFLMVVGILWCVLGGITGAYIGLYSEKLGKAGFSVTQILATRFYLLVIVSSLILFFTPHKSPIVIDWKFYLLATMIIVFFPLVMYQTAIKTLGTVMVSLLEPFKPVLTYLIQVVVVGYYHFNLTTMSLLVIASGTVIWLVRIEHHMIRDKNQPALNISGIEEA